MVNLTATTTRPEVRRHESRLLRLLRQFFVQVFIHVESHEMVDVDVNRKADLEWSQDSSHPDTDMKRAV